MLRASTHQNDKKESKYPPAEPVVYLGAINRQLVKITGFRLKVLKYKTVQLIHIDA